MKNNNTLPEFADYPIYNEPKVSQVARVSDYGYNYEEGYVDDEIAEEIADIPQGGEGQS
jgi:hypothetical protein